MKRRDFLKAGIGAFTATQVAETSLFSPAPFDLEEATIADLQMKIASGKETVVSITEKYLERIAQIDQSGPMLKSVIEVNPDALAIAKALDEGRKSGKVQGLMQGIPVLLKDNIETGDKMMTTAGSLALLGNVAKQDSFIAERLRKAGAVILGKTNLSEWANFRSTHSTSGWSGRGGQTKNPYALDRNPCGSSSGSGVAASANLCTVAIGTETDGSIVCPATSNGLVGIKPTLGLVSRSGIIPLAHSQDTAGPMTRTMRDAAILLTAISGIYPSDIATNGFKGERDYTRFLDLNGLKGARIGVGRQFFGFSQRVDAVMNEAIAAMKNQGAEVIDSTDMATSGKYDDTEFEVLLYEFKADINTYLSSREAMIGSKTLEDLIAMNEKMKDKEMPYFGQEIFHMAQEKGPLTDKKYIDALKKNRRLSGKEGIDKVMDKHKLDAIIAPTGGPAWTTDLVNGDHFSGGSSSPAAVSGYPAISVPAGFVRGLPVGITFFGRAWSESTLIKLAFAFEQATMVRRPPKYLPTAELP